MSYAVVLYLDDRSSRRIEEIWGQMAQKDISSIMIEEHYRPHITLGACEELSLETCTDELKSFAAGFEPFTIETSYLGIFPHEKGAVFLGVTVTEELSACQKSFHEIFGRHGIHIIDVFAPGRWVPHCSLAYHESPEKDLRAIQIGMGLDLPLVATCTALAVIEFPPWNERLAVPLGVHSGG